MGPLVAPSGTVANTEFEDVTLKPSAETPV